MQNSALSVPLLRRRIELKAYAYGISSTVATLLSEYVIDLLRKPKEDLTNKPTEPYGR